MFISAIVILTLSFGSILEVIFNYLNAQYFFYRILTTIKLS